MPSATCRSQNRQLWRRLRRRRHKGPRHLRWDFLVAGPLTNLELAILGDVHVEQRVEGFRVTRRLELLGGGVDGDVRHALPSGALAIAFPTGTHVRGEIVAN